MHEELKQSMDNLSEKDRELVEKIYQNRQKARRKWLDKVNSPEYQKQQREKEAVRRAKNAEKARARRQEKLDELKAQTRERVQFESEGLQDVVMQSRKNRVASQKRNPTSKKPRASKSSKGTKGRNPTAEEGRMADKLGALPCICCSILQERGLIPAEIDLIGDTQHNEVSLHHIDGRTKPMAHFKQLPLCGWHHQNAIPVELRDDPVYQYLVPVHADGIWGGKAPFKALFGSEQVLLEICYKRIGEHDFFLEHLS